ncbi:MAG: MFS transporter [Methanomicrobia archaeon]|nr:MFS transporter [Methanomicrobia archaeon]
MKDHKTILVAWLFFSTVNGIMFPILPIYIYNLSESYIYVGLINALPALMLMFMSFIWGTLSDKIGKRKEIIFFSCFVGSVMYFSFGILNSELLIVIRTIQFVFLAGAYLVPALLTEYFPEEKGKALGNFQSFGALGWVIGGLSAGYLYNSGYIFVASGILTLIFAFLMTTIEEIPKNVFKEFYFFKFGNFKVLTYLALATIILMTSSNIVFGLFSVYMKGFGVSEINIGRVSALTGICVVLTTTLAGIICDKFGSEKIFILTNFSYIWIWIALGITQNMIIFAIIYAIPVYSFFFTSANSMAADATSIEERGRGIGLLNSSISLGMFAGPLIGGFLAQLFNIPFAFIFAGFLCIFSTILALYLGSFYER